MGRSSPSSQAQAWPRGGRTHMRRLALRALVGHGGGHGQGLDALALEGLELLELLLDEGHVEQRLLPLPRDGAGPGEGLEEGRRQQRLVVVQDDPALLHRLLLPLPLLLRAADGGAAAGRCLLPLLHLWGWGRECCEVPAWAGLHRAGPLSHISHATPCRHTDVPTRRAASGLLFSGPCCCCYCCCRAPPAPAGTPPWTPPGSSAPPGGPPRCSTSRRRRARCWRAAPFCWGCSVGVLLLLLSGLGPCARLYSLLLPCPASRSGLAGG